MSNSLSSAPYSQLNGIWDQSTESVAREELPIPQHLPWFPTYAVDGPTEVQYVDGAAALAIYGDESFDERSAYATHATPFINKASGNGNLLALKRVLPADAGPKANLGFYLDVLPTKVALNQRNADGSLKYDSAGKVIPTGATVDGYKLKWTARQVDPAKFGIEEKITGTQVDPDTSVQSTLYPMFCMEYPWFGPRGAMTAVRLWAPTSKSADPANTAVIGDQRAYLYRCQFLRKVTGTTTANVIKTIDDEQYRDFAFKTGVIDKGTDLELGYDVTVPAAWRDLEPIGTKAPTFGPCGKFFVYEDYLEEVLQLLHTAELAYGTVGSAASDYHLVNILSGVSWDGIPYNAITMVSVIDGGLTLNEDAVHYLQGGSAGTMSYDNFDLLVRNELENFGQLEDHYLDRLRHPMSYFYDSGYKLPTKKAMIKLLGLRKDIGVILGTQDVTLPQNTQAEESSTALALISYAQMVPEAVIYGTGVIRMMIMGQSGKLLNSRYKGLLPLTYEILDKLSSYAGSGTGKYVSDKSPTDSDNNRITLFKTDTINSTYKTDSVRNKDWANGMNWCSYCDHRTLFIPAYQSVYGEDTSIYKSWINVMIAIELEKVCDRTWTFLVGNDKLSPEQFIERSDKLIEERADESRFDGRATITPKTQFTAADKARNWSWSTSIVQEGNGLRTVGSFTIVGRRAATAS